jgi:thimet oligopeptidase
MTRPDPFRLRTVVLALAACAASTVAIAATPAIAPAAVSLPGPAFPTFQDAGQMNKACDDSLAGAELRRKQLQTIEPGMPWLRAWDDLQNWEQDTAEPIEFLQNVHPDPAVRGASEACEQRWSEFQSALGVDEAVYRGGVASLDKLKDPIDRRVVQLALEDFEDSGMALAPEQRAKAKALSDRLTAVALDFTRNIRDANVKVTFTTDELKGVPEAVWKDAPRDAQGRVVLGVSNPVYGPVMERAADAGARERMYRAKLSEGGEANLKLLAQLGQLRQEYARLFGLPSYDDFVLRRRMVGSTSRALKFLDDVKDAVREGEQKDIAELRAAKARLTAQPLEATTVARWDVAYYTEILRQEKYAIDAESMRQYFPPEASLHFVQRIAERLFDVRYVQVPGTYWHPDVQAYAVIDNKTNQPLQALYVDLYPREGKYNHAAVWSYRNEATAWNRTAQAALVVNFNRKGLTLSELEVLLHEFGHSLHSGLSHTRWTSDGGTHVKRDFVEAPSQMLEDWVYDKQVLKLFQEVCPTCKPVPDALVDQAKAARDFGKGLRYARQHLYASFDLAIHGPGAPDPMATWIRMEGATPLGYVPGTMFPAGFGHLASGYESGYYGYLWSLVVAMDLRTAFAADKLSPVVGARYREKVLGQGGEQEPGVLVHDFLGRDFSSAPFFDYMRK